jgi:predicted RND superfamily exporter protein
VEWSYWAILIAIFSATFVLCLIAFRSAKVAVILLIPLAVSQVLCELIMIVLHIDLNIDSLPVAAVGVGVGIDYGIYLMSRLREEAFDYDFDQARLRALLTTGKVIMFTAATLFIGVVFWLFATMKFQAEMGMLIGLLMVFNMIGALVFIPALTGILKPSFVLGKKGKEGIA